jgi:hypothetical protein
MANANTKTSAAGTETATRTGREIPNIARLTDAQLRAALIRHGLRPKKDASRAALIQAARNAKLWDYKGDVVPAHYKAKYGKAQNCGDSVSAEMVRPNGMSMEEHLRFLADVADANGVDFARWDHCNYGQKVMNLGNVLRGKIKRGDYVIVGVTEWNEENA